MGAPRAGGRVPLVSVFVDTSALYALLDADDSSHPAALKCLDLFDQPALARGAPARLW